MNLPRFLLPVKWFYHAHIWGLRMRLRNLWIFADAVWHFDTCDYAPLLRLIHVATVEMRDMYRHHGRVVDSDKIARQITVVSELCKRMEREEYFDNAGYSRSDWGLLPDKEKQRIARHATYMMRQDAQYLGKTMAKIQSWWQ